METRPEITTVKSGADLRCWYWTKAELIDCARFHGLKKSGGKFLILDRIAHFLDTGEKTCPNDVVVKQTSKFDWHSAALTRDTVITDNYKNSQNVRRFFQAEADPKFKFNIAFMDWMKANVGKTLGDAIDEFRAQKVKSSDPNFKTDIQDHNQFNQYTRDFLADNPNASMDEVRKVWAKKRSLPTKTGRHRYDKSDLDL